MAYLIMCYDEPLLLFELGERSRITMQVQVSGYRRLSERSIAQGIEHKLETWLSSRRAPRSRAYMDKLLLAAGITSFDSLIQVTKLLSLNDAFWVKSSGDKVSCWKSVNLYDNPFNEVVMHLAFEGKGLGGLPVRSTSPEFTTDGMLPKCWRRESGRIVLCKGGTSGWASNAGWEPYSEYYASQLAEFLGLDVVNYQLGKLNGNLVSKCPLFTSQELGYSAIYKLIPEGSTPLDAIFALYRENDWFEYLRDMYLLDALTLNPDRHLGNFGVLVNNRTGAFVKPAPIFDNGASLLAYYRQDGTPITDDLFVNLQSLETYASNFYEPYAVTLKGRDLLGTRQKQLLRRVLSFTFTEHPRFKLPDNRVGFLTHMVRSLAKFYLTL